MAKIQTESIQITFSRLVKDSDKDSTKSISPDIISALEQVAQELAGEHVVVEIALN